MPWQDQLVAEHQKRRENNLWRTRYEVGSPQSVEIRREGKSFLNFTSNDYLGLAGHPRLAEASALAARKWGAGTGASHLVSGHQSPHHALEEELAEFVGAEDALLFSTGYMANLAIPTAFLDRGDLLVQDKLNHASLIDSGLLGRADFKRFRHCDTKHAEKLLVDSKARRNMISTDGVFSMDGNIAPLAELNALAKDHDALLVVDDAHGFGTLGRNGRGSTNLSGLKIKDNLIMMGTLGKALGSFGAFVAGDRIYIDHLKQSARSYIYTTALPATVVEATRAALRLTKEAAQERQHLKNLIAYFRKEATTLRLPLMDSETAIQPLLLGSESAALAASKQLEKDGIWVTAIRPPTVPKGTARLRICLSSNHDFNHINQLIESLTSITIEAENVEA